MTAKAIQAFERWLKHSDPNPNLGQRNHPEDLSYLHGLQEGCAISQLKRHENPSADHGESKQGREGMEKRISRAGAAMDMIMGLRRNALLMPKQFLAIGGIVIAASAYAALLLMGAGLWWAGRT